MPERAEPARGAGRRTPNDVSALCVELLRAVREHEFRGARRGGGSGGGAGRAAAASAGLDRAFRAWHADLERRGPLHVVVDERGLRTAGDSMPVGRGRLDELARRLRERGVTALTFEPGLDAPAWRAFVALLSADPAEVARHGGGAALLPEGAAGLVLEGAVAEPVPEEEKPEPESAAASAAETPAAPDRRTASPDPAPERGAQTEASTLPTPGTVAARNPATWSGHLAAARDDVTYAATVQAAVRAALDASDAGDPGACHDIMLALSDQADARSREGAPTVERRALALDGVRELISGRRLPELLARAAGDDREESLRAGRILVQLADEAAPALLHAIEGEDGARRDQLLGVAVALGRTATPALRRAMEGSSPRRARIAANLAGEIQDARAVPALSRLLLEHEDVDVRSEAARALATIGDERALAALEAGLESPHEDVSRLCAWCLSVTGRSDAARALTGALRRARRARRIGLAGAVIRSLGELGREEPVPELRRILERRSLFRRRELHELKLQALEALACMPGEQAREVLEAVAAGSDMSLAVAARRALKNHAADTDNGV